LEEALDLSSERVLNDDDDDVPCTLISSLGLHLVRVYFQSGQPVSWNTFETRSSSVQITDFLKLLFATLMFWSAIEIMSFLLTFLQ